MRTTIGVAALAALLLAPAPVQAESHLVVKVQSRRAEAQGIVLVTLASGTQVRIPAADIDDLLSKAIDSAVTAQAAERKAASSSAPPSDGSSQTTIRTKCSADWPADFSMRAYCEKQQREALAELRHRTIDSADLRTIRKKCTEDWPDDFQMRNYCEEQQIAALGALGR